MAISWPKRLLPTKPVAYVHGLGPRLLRLGCRWGRSIYDSFVGPNGYKAITWGIGIYVALFSLVLGSHERQKARVATSMGTFFTLVSSTPSNFTFALSAFAQTASMKISAEPELLNPLSWPREENPNARPLVQWLTGVSRSCGKGSCGAADDAFRGDLSDADLSGLDFDYPRAHLDLRSMTMPRLNLTDARASEANFSGSNMSLASLAQFDGEGSDFTGVNLRGAKLVGARLGALPRSGESPGTPSKFIGADLRGVNGACVSFKGALLDNANFARMPAERLLEGSLERADFSEASLIDANFEDAILWDANFEGANLTGAKFDRAQYTERTKFPPGFDTSKLILRKRSEVLIDSYESCEWLPTFNDEGAMRMRKPWR